MFRDIAQQTIVNVDLTTGEIEVEEVSVDDLRGFLGGRGIGAKLLMERLAPHAGALGPENILIFATGTLSGTTAPMSGRSTVLCKSPATGLYLKTSAGGHFGAELKFAGVDYVVVRGAAPRPVYLWITDGTVEVRDATHLWGRGTREADRLIKEELGDEGLQTALIGPAGENKVLFACIVVSLFSAAGRGGAGAVMGSKNLKGIAVRGTGGLMVRSGKEFCDLSNQVRRLLAEDSSMKAIHQWGTSFSIPGLNAMGMLATRNFSESAIEGAELISGEHLESAGYLVGRESCTACSTACHRLVRSKEAAWGKILDSGPEMETMASLGSECGIVDTEAVLKANQLCMDLGMDTISAGHVIAWAMESYERGLLKDESGGLVMRFGNVEAEHDLLRRIAYRNDPLGDMLANGTRQAAEAVGGESWKWAIQAKGLEQSACDTRLAKGYALAFAVNPRGPDHLHTECLAEFGMTPEMRALCAEITGDEKYAVPFMLDKRAEIVRWHEDTFATSDALGFCAFSSTSAYEVSPERMALFFFLATGLPMTTEELMRAGQRIINVERCFNSREGLRREHDVLPWRMMNEPVSSGPCKGHVTDRQMLDRLLDDYYLMHGWDPETGVPTRGTLERLGLLGLCAD